MSAIYILINFYGMFAAPFVQSPPFILVMITIALVVLYFMMRRDPQYGRQCSFLALFPASFSYIMIFLTLMPQISSGIFYDDFAPMMTYIILYVLYVIITFAMVFMMYRQPETQPSNERKKKREDEPQLYVPPVLLDPHKQYRVGDDGELVIVTAPKKKQESKRRRR